jgi:hypothetical protein
MRKTTFLLIAAIALATASQATPAGAEPTRAPPPPVAFTPFPELAKPTSPAASPAAAYNVTATFTGLDPATSKSWTVTSLIAGVEHITSPRDIATGQASGKRQHEPLRVVAAAPAGFAGNQLQKVVLHYVPVDPKTKLPTHTLTLNGLVILGQRPQTLNGIEYTEIAMTYRQITWTWTEGGKTFSDDWTQ